uniref:Uncharacterized protein n=1 Tax=Cucumis melo TaxID=3656 RepID=A0A9I9DS14_CUCME
MGELTPPRGDCQPFRLVYTWQEKDGDLQPRGLLIVRVTVTSKSLVFIGFLLSASVTGPIAGCHADSPLGRIVVENRVPTGHVCGCLFGVGLRRVHWTSCT